MGKRLRRFATGLVVLLEPAGFGLMTAAIWRYDESIALAFAGVVLAVYGNLLRRS
jgi:hypothetical protein